MSLTLIESPQLIMPVYNPIYFKVSSNKTTEEAFNFIFDIYINGTYITRENLLTRPGVTYSVFSPSRILESYLSYDLSHNYINASASTNCILDYKIVFGEEYVSPWRFYDNSYQATGTYSGYTTFYSSGNTHSYVAGDSVYVVQDSGYTSSIYNGVFTVLTASTTAITVNMLHSVSTPVNGGLVYYSDRRKTIFTAGTPSYSGYAFNSVLQYEQVPVWDYLDYIPLCGSTSAVFLTNQPTTSKIKITDRQSIGYFNYGKFSGDSAINGILVTSYQRSGGTSINLIVSSAYGNNTTDGLINEFGVGPWNLNQISPGSFYAGGQPVINYDRDYKYDVQLYNFGALPASEIRTYELNDSCSKYEDVRFAFLNRLGQFDYFTCDLVSRKNINVTRNTYQKTLPYNYVVGDRGKTVISIDAQETYTVVSDWLSESESNWLAEIFTSPEVYILNNSTGALTPIIIDNSTIEIQKKNNGQLINYTFEYSKAVMINSQRG